MWAEGARSARPVWRWPSRSPIRPSCGPSGRDGPARSSTTEPERYRRFSGAAGAGRWPAAAADASAPAALGGAAGGAGKALTLLRLVKASDTYAGGIDYLAWKINRHAGTKIEVRPWQRRWPLLGRCSALLPRLCWRRGGHSLGSTGPALAATRRHGQSGDGERLPQDVAAAQLLASPASPT